MAHLFINKFQLLFVSASVTHMTYMEQCISTTGYKLYKPKSLNHHKPKKLAVMEAERRDRDRPQVTWLQPLHQSASADRTGKVTLACLPDDITERIAKVRGLLLNEKDMFCVTRNRRFIDLTKLNQTPFFKTL